MDDAKQELMDWDDEWGQLLPNNAPIKFNSGEHADIPSECSIPTGNKDEKVSGKYDGFRLHEYHYPPDGEKLVGSWNPLNLLSFHPGKELVSYRDKNNKDIGLTFSQVLALAGDFFCGEPIQHCIARGKSFSIQKGRFSKAIENVTNDPGGVAPNMRQYLSDEITGIEAALADVPKLSDADPGKKGPQNIVQNYVSERNGVASNPATIKLMGPIYSTILLYNMDHFGKDAWMVYRAGHALALGIAKTGNGTIESLKSAYLHDAFALHFLTDQFASGHIRTPRIEFNVPSGYLTALQAANWITEHVLPESMQVAAGVWDRGTNYMHDTDGAIGLRVRNLKGESWITYGDKQFFAEPNRINRLKSIECTQSSIDEIFVTWSSKEYPANIKASNGNLDNEGDTDKYAALQIAPRPMTTFVDNNHDATGNASCFWVVERNPDFPDMRDNAIFQEPPKQLTVDEQKAADKAAEEADKKAKAAAAKLPAKSKSDDQPNWVPAVEQDYSIDSGNARISGQKMHTENGYFFARRADVDLCSLNQFQWGNPGFGDGSLLASSDAAYISKCALRKHDLTPSSVRAVEIYSGGFVQPQEYRKKNGTVNYAINVWGPVEVPIRFISEQTLKERKGSGWSKDELEKTARQYTFTFRGRRTELNKNPEAADSTKNYRWLSWADVGKTGKTSLLKISHSYKDADAAKQNAIVVEGWALNDPFPKTPYQYTKYESLKSYPEGLVFGGASDRADSKNDFNKVALVSGLQKNHYELYAHMTRFFLFPFRQESSLSNPDIVTFTWKGDDVTKPQAVISVASTGNLLTSPKVNPPYPPQTVDSQDVPVLSGFVKRFEDTNNRPILLHARATTNDPKPGLTILPQIYYLADGGTSLQTSAKSIQMTTDVTLPKGDNYQVLVGDTRYSGHREMVVMAGAFPDYYLQAYEYKDLKWAESSPIMTGPISQNPTWKKQSSKTGWKNYNIEHRVAALIPNEPVKNGLNVLLVTYYAYEQKLNFRTYIKAGEAPPEGPKPIQFQPTQTQPTQTQPVQAQPAQAQPVVQPPVAQLPPNQSAGPQWQWVVVSWNDQMSSIIPSWVFIPPNTLSSPPTVTDQSTLGGFGNNENLNFFAKLPVPKPDYNSAFYTAMVTCPTLKPGALVTAPVPWYGGVDATTPRQKYGRFDAITLNYGTMKPTTLKTFSPNDTAYTGMDSDGTLSIVGHSQVKLRLDWRNEKNLKTKYGFDAVTRKPIAVMLIQINDEEARILNPEILFEGQDAGMDKLKSAQPQQQATTRSLAMPSNPTPVTTIPRAAVPTERPKSGWSGYVDCLVDDELSGNEHFKDMGWRMVNLGSIVNKKEQYGIMNVFSFHGMLGVRVWAPAEPGRWNQWISRGCTPYLGQTSLGTGWDSSGHWNDNASQLSWGICEDFPDFNLWHGEIDKSGTFSWNIVEGTGWSIPITQAKRPYARGYESKKPEWPHQVKRAAK